MTTNLDLPESYDRFINIIDRVRHGEEIIIYSAGTPVAKISPIIEAKKAKSTRTRQRSYGYSFRL
jgi:prevent-host-death family protein